MTLRTVIPITAIIVAAMMHVMAVFFFLFREHNGVWYNCMYSESSVNAQLACKGQK